MIESQLIRPSSRIGILWGGGLGDLLVLRVFLQGIAHCLEKQPVFMTTAFHLPKIFQEFCVGVDVVIISRTPRRLVPLITEWRKHFDLLYLGPHPTLKTFFLGRLLAPGRLWVRRHRERQPYLVEQLLGDLSAFGLHEPELDEVFANALPWKVHHEYHPFGNEIPFLALHAGAKQGWQTTRWPFENWRDLIRKILQNSSYSLCLLGIDSEGEMLSSLVEPLPQSLRNRVCLALSRPLKDVAAIIVSSYGVICHNSGLLHLATFLKQKTISITGSSAHCWRPCYPWVVNVTSGQCDLACNCYRCPVPFFHAKCIQGLSVERVWQAVTDHLQMNG